MYNVIARADRAGSHFFDADTMRFFNSRVLDATLTQIGADGDHFRFVTSERYDWDSPRRYTVRSVEFYRYPDNNGTPREHVTVDTVGEFQAYGSAAQAKRHLRDDPS